MMLSLGAAAPPACGPAAAFGHPAFVPVVCVGHPAFCAGGRPVAATPRVCAGGRPESIARTPLGCELVRARCTPPALRVGAAAVAHSALPKGRRGARLGWLASPCGRSANAK